MSQSPQLTKLLAELNKLADKHQALILQRFFKTGPGQYGAGDIFLGIKVPLQRQVAKKYQHLSLAEISKLLGNPFHEARLVGLLILVEQYEAATTKQLKATLVDFYLKHQSAINNWDLVDLSAPKILGDFLWQNPKQRSILTKLARSHNLWSRRIAIVATFAFIKHGQSRETLKIAKILINDQHDLIHKAVGWMLREVGKRIKRSVLEDFLRKQVNFLPRITLRYSLEHFSKSEREKYLKIN